MSDSNSCQLRCDILQPEHLEKKKPKGIFIEATTVKTNENNALPYTSPTCSQGTTLPGLNQSNRLVLSSLEELD